MKFGLFNAPYALPALATKDVLEWGIQLARWGDELGIDEIWFAEHYTTGWQISPAPELMIAAASRVTENITLAAGAHLVPYQNPIALAYRIMALDHLTGGRYIAGVGAGAYPADQRLFQTNGANTDMLAEGLEIMHRVWEGKPFTYEGSFWSADYPEHDEFFAGPSLRPLQSPHPPVAMAGSSPKSASFQIAGSKGYIPLSFAFSADHLHAQWEGYAAAAAGAGLEADRSTWRVCREVLVADTDEEAYELAAHGAMGQIYDGHMIQIYQRGGRSLAPGYAPEDVTAEVLARNVWLVGSPETVRQKIEAEYEASGGFGTLIAFDFAYFDAPEAYRRSLELLATEVAPKVAHLGRATSDLA